MDDPDKDSGGKIEVSLNISLPNLHCDCEYIHKIPHYSPSSFNCMREALLMSSCTRVLLNNTSSFLDSFD